MVRIVSVRSLPNPWPTTSHAGFRFEPTWICEPLAKWLQGAGYRLDARDCGDRTWAVLAEKRGAETYVVATGLASLGEAQDRIRDWTTGLVASLP